MRQRVEEVEYLKLGFLKHLFGQCPQLPLADLSSGVVFTGSGRASLRIILEYYVNKGIIQNRNNEVLIPQWLCQTVTYSLHRFCHPVLSDTKKLKAVVVYHQYGFPQKMDEIVEFCKEEKIYLIEDCAHAYESFFNNKRLGTFGDAAIFSFSKFFPSILGGALVTTDKELIAYANSRLGESRHSNLVYTSRLLYELFKDSALGNSIKDMQEMVYAMTDRAFKIKNISLLSIGQQLRKNCLQKRRANYKFILDFFADRAEYFSGLEKEGVTPYVVPLFAKEGILKKMVQSLADNRITSGIYHFDVNRNVLSPHFEKCLWVPVHQGLGENDLERICLSLRKVQ